MFLADLVGGKWTPQKTVAIRFNEHEASVPGILAKVQDAESHQDSSSVVQVSDSIKYKQPKKKTICEHVNIRSIFLYICFIDSRMLCTIVNKKIHFISEKLIIIV